MWRDKWCVDLQPFLQAGMEEDQQQANSHFMQQYDRAAAIRQQSTLIAVVVEEGGIVQIKTFTFQAAVLHLLQKMAEHSLHNEDAASAISSFLGCESVPGGAAATLVY